MAYAALLVFRNLEEDIHHRVISFDVRSAAEVLLGTVSSSAVSFRLLLLPNPSSFGLSRICSLDERLSTNYFRSKFVRSCSCSLLWLRPSATTIQSGSRQNNDDYKEEITATAAVTVIQELLVAYR